MATAIINAQVDAINSTLGELATDLTTLRPLVKDVKDSVVASYITDTATGAIASFSDGADGIPVKDLKVAIEPVQNLNGQSAPYPAGGGKNKLADSVPSNAINATMNSASIVSATNARVWAIPCETNTDYTMSQDSTGNAWTIGFATSYPTVGATVDYRGNMQNRTSWTQNSGSNTYLLIGVPSTGGLASIVALHAQIEKGSSPTSYAPYSNICPITGWTGAEVTRDGGASVVVWDATSEGKYIDQDGTIGTSTSFHYSEYFPVNVGKHAYYFTVSGIAVNTDMFTTRIHCYDSSKTWISQAASLHVEGNGLNILPFETPSNVKYIRISNSHTKVTTDSYIYERATYPITWQTEAGTVYGGTLDVTTGELVVKAVSYFPTGTGTSASGNSFSKGASTAHNIYYSLSTTSTPLASPQTTEKPNEYLYCSHFPVGNQSTDNTYCVGSGQIRIILPASDERNTAEKFNQWVADQITAGTPLQCTAMLAPENYVTVQLTPTEVSTILGQNNIWADCGDVDVEYRADTKLYINKMIANALNA